MRLNLPVLPRFNEDTLGGVYLRLQTYMWGSQGNSGGGFPPPVTTTGDTIFRWNLPTSSHDAMTGLIGARTPGIWHPGRTVRPSMYGKDGEDFAGKTPTERVSPEDEEWL